MKLSIVIPTFNRRHTLAPAIDSSLAQAVGDLEVLVVDDGSTDGTAEWIAQTYPDGIVSCVRNAGAKGPAGARNTGIRIATGDLIALLDSDDAFLPGHLVECASVFARHADVDVIFGRAIYERDGSVEDYMGPNFERKLSLAPKAHVEECFSIFSSKFFDHLLQYGCWFNLSSVVMRRDAACEFMNESLRISEDYEFWVRLARTRRFACLHRPQIRYALHGTNLSGPEESAAIDNSPHLVTALKVIRQYPGLGGRSIDLIDEQLANILFDWAYQCAVRGRAREALRLHLASLSRGKRAANLLAILKMPATLLKNRQLHAAE